MPVLNRGAQTGRKELDRASVDFDGRLESAGKRDRLAVRGGLLERCSNPRCESGWLHLWRSRSGPVFEGGWTCSPACTEKQVQVAVHRELDGRGRVPAPYRHRLPLGLLMMEQGWITAPQLKHALEAQKEARGVRLGHILVRQQGVSEQLVTRALSLQWSCPVLPLEFHDPEALSPLMPRLFVDAFAALPLRLVAGKLVYLAFDERLDPVLALALERMSGLRVESGLVRGSEYRPAHERMLQAAFPAVELLEAASEPALVRTLARVVERARPVESHLVRVHDCLWMRMWNKLQSGPLPDAGSVQDVIGSIGE
jgi:hypothetical protein